MKIVQSVASLLYKIWVGLVFTVFMIILFPGIVLPFLLGQRFGAVGYAFLWLWSWIFSKLTFIRYKFYGKEHFEKGKTYIYVSNHTSFLDIPGLTMLLPGQFRPLAKKNCCGYPSSDGSRAAQRSLLIARVPRVARKASTNSKHFSTGVSPF